MSKVVMGQLLTDGSLTRKCIKQDIWHYLYEWAFSVSESLHENTFSLVICHWYNFANKLIKINKIVLTFEKIPADYIFEVQIEPFKLIVGQVLETFHHDNRLFEKINKCTLDPGDDF